MITIPHATEAIRMQAFQTHTAAQPISIQLPQTQQKPHVTEARHNAEKHSLLHLSVILFTGGRGGIPACIADGISACLADLQGVVSQHALQVSRPTPKGRLRGSGPGPAPPPPPADGYCFGWYASYWNTFFFLI